jgi:hypothetical protein
MTKAKAPSAPVTHTPTPSAVPAEPNKGDRTIFVVESGWVFICESWVLHEGMYYLGDTNVIRVFGTTEGLGQIALKGPTKDTVFDYCGNPNVPYGKALFLIPCPYKGKLK